MYVAPSNLATNPERNDVEWIGRWMVAIKRARMGMVMNGKCVGTVKSVWESMKGAL
jgi:hypothetical protein